MTSPGHRTREGDSRNTPAEIVAMLAEFGHIDLDPCSNVASLVESHVRFPWQAYGRYKTPGELQAHFVVEDGLSAEWSSYAGLVYVNGPWSDLLPWVEKCAAEYLAGCEILFLARTESATEWARLLARTRCAHVDLAKRYCFPCEGQPPTTDTRPTTISYFGERVERFAAVFSKYGFVYGRPLR